MTTPKHHTQRQRALIENLHAGLAGQRAREEVDVVCARPERSAIAPRHGEQRAAATAEFPASSPDLIRNYRRPQAILFEYDRSGLRWPRKEDGFSERVAARICRGC